MNTNWLTFLCVSDPSKLCTLTAGESFVHQCLDGEMVNCIAVGMPTEFNKILSLQQSVKREADVIHTKKTFKIQTCNAATCLFINENMAEGRLVVPPGSTNLLNIRLKTLGHVVMDDCPDIRLVQTHPKRNRGNNDT